MPLADLISILQLAIGPVILISGCGMLLLTMTNRFGRITDRVRQLARELREAIDADRRHIEDQLRILSRRARIIRAASALAACSALLAAFLIISLFLAAMLELSIVWPIVVLFTLCMLCLIGSQLLFIADIDLSLRALWLEMPAGIVDAVGRPKNQADR